MTNYDKNSKIDTVIDKLIERVCMGSTYPREVKRQIGSRSVEKIIAGVISPRIKNF